MRRVEDGVGAELAAMLVVGLALLVALPAGYVIKVLVRTGSFDLLAAAVAFLVIGCLALVTQAPVLVWLAVLIGTVTLIVARVAEVRGAEEPGTDFRPLPFEEYRW